MALQSQNSSTWSLWISGRVQGVGYRRFAQKIAKRLGLVGWARNLKDGRVEIRVTANEASLEQFMKELQKGPMLGEVTEIKKTPAEPGAFSDFSIEKDG